MAGICSSPSGMKRIHVAMQQVARETWLAYERRLEGAQVPASQRADYHKWTRFYLDFCHKYGLGPRSPTSLGPFLSKLAARKQSVEQRNQAAQAISLLIGPTRQPGTSFPAPGANRPSSMALTPGRPRPVIAHRPA